MSVFLFAPDRTVAAIVRKLLSSDTGLVAAYRSVCLRAPVRRWPCHLPIDILISILSYLSGYDIFSTSSLVCQTWRQAIAAIPPALKQWLWVVMWRLPTKPGILYIDFNSEDGYTETCLRRAIRIAAMNNQISLSDDSTKSCRSKDRSIIVHDPATTTVTAAKPIASLCAVLARARIFHITGFADLRAEYVPHFVSGHGPASYHNVRGLELSVDHWVAGVEAFAALPLTFVALNITGSDAFLSAAHAGKPFPGHVACRSLGLKTRVGPSGASVITRHTIPSIEPNWGRIDVTKWPALTELQIVGLSAWEIQHKPYTNAELDAWRHVAVTAATFKTGLASSLPVVVASRMEGLVASLISAYDFSLSAFGSLRELTIEVNEYSTYYDLCTRAVPQTIESLYINFHRSQWFGGKARLHCATMCKDIMNIVSAFTARCQRLGTIDIVCIPNTDSLVERAITARVAVRVARECIRDCPRLHSLSVRCRISDDNRAFVYTPVGIWLHAGVLAAHVSLRSLRLCCPIVIDDALAFIHRFPRLERIVGRVLTDCRTITDGWPLTASTGADAWPIMMQETDWIP